MSDPSDVSSILCRLVRHPLHPCRGMTRSYFGTQFCRYHILSQCARTEAHGSDNERDRFHHLVLCWCLSAVANVDIRVDVRQYAFPLIAEISRPLEASRVPAPP